jgi:hypothetical protein
LPIGAGNRNAAAMALTLSNGDQETRQGKLA